VDAIVHLLRGIGAPPVPPVDGAANVIDVVCDPPPKVAVTTADCVDEIAPAVAVKLELLDAAATATLAGTVSAELLLASAIVAPLAPAACDSVMLHVAVSPEFRLAGTHDTDFRTAAAGATLSDVVCELLLNVAVKVAVWLVELAVAVAVNVLLVEPAGIETLAGTVIT
jgi:hypothetical protein